MFTKYLALLSESDRVQFNEVAQIAAALQKQITRDFTPIWQIPATIDAFARLEDVPSDYWPIIIQDDIGFDAVGIHLDRNGQPFALIQAGRSTSLTCSHEVIEMLVDPFGNRLVASQSIIPTQGRVNYLVEPCDPSEGEQFGYTVNGILLSDFYTSNYFDPVPSPSVRYSFTGAITKPREVLQGGYVSWMIPETGEWFQATFFEASLQFRSLGVLQKKITQSWRETIDTLTNEPLKKLAKTISLKGSNLSDVMLSPSIKESFTGRAIQLKEDIDEVIRMSNRTSAIIRSDTQNSIETLVKLSVLNAGGRGGNPNDLDEDTELTDLLTVPEHFVQLRAFLVSVIRERKPTGSISTNEIENCTTVKELIEVVIEKLSNS